MRFSKWHALGNTYLLVESSDLGGAFAPDDARRLCDPHQGVGADGVLEIVDVRGAEADIVVWNPDGSTAELSGNGARIAALWLARRSGVAFPRVRLGERIVPARVEGDEVEVDLGEANVGKPEALEVEGARLEVTPVSIGNPHAVIRREPSHDELVRIGPLVERHERFPKRTNVQLVRPDGPNDLTVVVWERGAGETMSSGSSAAAAAAAAVTHGWCVSPVRVHLPGGTLTVDIREGRAILSGPVAEIFRGETV
ncbi:MAG: diaminopimelate epimerase [Actinobacteria bacterium]|nr:diaminopimelate epimerase [Actinomycetota bacterium]